MLRITDQVTDLGLLSPPFRGCAATLLAPGSSTFVAAIFSNLLTAPGADARFLPCCVLRGAVCGAKKHPAAPRPVV